MPRPLQLPGLLVVLALLAALGVFGLPSAADPGEEDAAATDAAPAAESALPTEQVEHIDPLVEESHDAAANHNENSGQESETTLAADPKLEQLRDRLRQVLAYYEKQRLNTRDHSAWEMLHAVVGLGVGTQVHLDGPEGEARSAIGWLCFNQTFRGGQMLTLENGKPIGVIGVGLQGHHGQMLAYLAQTHLQRNYPMWVAGQEFTLEDLIENEKLTCYAGTELTFKLIGLAHYLPSDATWKTNAGENWSISRLIREEIVQPIQGAACGGTHRLTGLSYAVYKRQKEGKPLDGQFKRANTYIRDYHRYAFRLQNPDGSFSTQWLEYRDARPDLDRRLQTSGHILEWLAFSLPQGELQQPEMVRAVEYLSGVLWENRSRNLSWHIGSLGHGLHALAIYERRVFKVAEAKTALRLAQRAGLTPPLHAPGSTAPAKPKDAKSGKSQPSAKAPVIRSILRGKPPRVTPLKPAADSAGTNEPHEVPHISSESGPRLIPAQPWLQ